MEDLDFSSMGGKPAAPPPPKPAPAPPRPAAEVLYKPDVALAFFREHAKIETVEGGKPFFLENDKSSGLFSKGERMFLLLEGEVGLMAKGQFVGNVRPGEIFGEMAMIGRLPRTATAVARTSCKAAAMDEKQFISALQKNPDFALMMMGVMVNRLRQTLARKAGAAGSGAAAERQAVFNKKQLAEIADEIPPVQATRAKTIMTAGETGVFMYILQEGRVAISMNGKLIERVGPGSVFGEMALIDNASRAASAIAETDCSLILVKRTDFLALVKSKPEFGASILRTIAERVHFVASQP